MSDDLKGRRMRLSAEEVEVVNYGDNFVELTNYGNVENFKITWKSDKEFHKKFLCNFLHLKVHFPNSCYFVVE